MSELTTEQVKRLVAWAAVVRPSTEANADIDALFSEWFGQVRREAKAEALREAAERVSQLRDVSCMARDGMTDRQAAMERDYQYFRESPVGWLLDRADRMKDEK